MTTQRFAGVGALAVIWKFCVAVPWSRPELW
jgi:hypothetical protein